MSNLPQSFDNELKKLLEELESWSSDEKKSLAEADHSPPFDGRAALWSAIWFAIAQICSWLTPKFGHANVPAAFWSAVAIFFVAIVLSLTLFLSRAIGMGKPGFWSGFWSVISDKSNYPFTPLRVFADRDLKSVSRLNGYSVTILKACRERVDLEESELRERLSLLAGSPSLAVALALLAAAWTAWKNFHSFSDIGNTTVLCGSVMVFCLGVFAIRLRVALMELARCRSLLALAIACRDVQSE